MDETQPRAITGFTRTELTDYFRTHFKGGAQAADFFFSELYQKGVFDPRSIPWFSYSPDVLKSLDKQLYLPPVKIEQKKKQESVVKFVWQSEEGHGCEAVFLDMKGHGTLCVSSQIGCSMGCVFCETGQNALKRSLRVHEIIAQYMAAAFGLGLRADHLVFMGMGEPLVNLDQVLQAIRIFIDPRGPGILPARITLSTCGYVPGIEEFSRLCREKENSDFQRIHLAISLHAGNDTLRNRLMTVNRQFPLAELKKALVNFNRPYRKDRLYLEYVLLPGINDSEKDAREVADFGRGLKTTVNLIAYNPGSRPITSRPDDKAMGRFFDRLWAYGQPCRMRDSKGREIMAGCGQLVYH